MTNLLKLSGSISEISIGEIPTKLFKAIKKDGFEILSDPISDFGTYDEFDNIIHFYGVSLDDATLSLKIKNNETNKSQTKKLKIDNLKSYSFEPEMPPMNNKYFLFSKSLENGTYGSFKIDDENFDQNNLLLLNINLEEWMDGEYIWKILYGKDVDGLTDFLDNLEDVDYYGKYNYFRESIDDILAKFDVKELEYDGNSNSDSNGVLFNIFQNCEIILSNSEEEGFF